MYGMVNIGLGHMYGMVNIGLGHMYGMVNIGYIKNKNKR
jgi:hypothetical protein